MKWEWLQPIIELVHGFLVEETKTQCMFVLSDGRASHTYSVLTLHFHAERNKTSWSLSSFSSLKFYAYLADSLLGSKKSSEKG